MSMPLVRRPTGKAPGHLTRETEEEPVADRDYDLVLLGATGFTGGLTARELATRLRDTTVRWAIAGRDRAKLEAVRDQLPADPDIEVVDVHDLVGLLDLAERTKVLATTVGPYAQHGELVVQACVRAGTDYCDITGEPGFVDLIRKRYDADARRRGVRLVPCCGFDSVPHDLGVAYTVAQLPDDQPVEVRGYVHATGRFSGGTANSALEAIAERAMPDRVPPTSTDGSRRVGLLPARIHRVDRLDAYGVPLPTIDPVIVLRSARELPGYGPDFRYGHFAQVHRLPTLAAGVGGMAAFGALASLSPTRALLRRLLPASGEGPSEERRARSRFQVTFLGSGGGRRVITRVSGGDPGYDETAKMLAEAALSLAQDPHGDAAGVCTPAVALGEPYRRRLEDRGIRFETLEE
jgi:short subunit dehydrogenase-like uncharacterized protein